MNRLGFLILSVLSKSEAVDMKSAMTVKEIAEAEDLGYKDNTVYKKVTEFESMGYVATGYKDGKARTFYITNAGRSALELE